MLGLPDGVRACLFDLDGVLTDTAAVHRAAWAATFDPVLRAHGQQPFGQTDGSSQHGPGQQFDGQQSGAAAVSQVPPETGQDAASIIAQSGQPPAGLPPGWVEVAKYAPAAPIPTAAASAASSFVSMDTSSVRRKGITTHSPNIEHG